MAKIEVSNFELECGEQLERLEISYQTFGTLNAQRDNVVWVCHALTGNADVLDWWAGLDCDAYCMHPLLRCVPRLVGLDDAIHYAGYALLLLLPHSHHRYTWL